MTVLRLRDRSRSCCWRCSLLGSAVSPAEARDEAADSDAEGRDRRRANA